MEDNQLSDGIFKAVQNDAGTIVGMAWAVPQSDSDGIRVIEILYDTQLTHDILLHLLQNDAHGRPLTVCRQPSDNSDMKLQSYGMARLVNVESALSVIASEYPALRIAIRVSDPIIARNNNTYLLADGIVTVTNRIPDLDLNINVLTSIIFSPSHIGNIIGLPTVRPSMTLMLD
jgi:hypothetical protein